jgi:hypothetical protein
MTQAQTLDPVHGATAPSTQAGTRIRLRTPLSGAGFIDGAWWPRTRDLTAELPALVEALIAAGNVPARFTYNVKAWDAAPALMRIDGHKVRLGSFATSNPSTVSVVDTSGRKHVDLLVIDPATEAATAERALQIAGRAESLGRADEILSEAGDGLDVKATS